MVYSASDTGAVYVFKRTGTRWNLEHTFHDQQTDGLTSLEGNDYFGIEVALEGNYLAVGANWDDGVSGDDSGEVYMFRRSHTTWDNGQELSETSQGADPTSWQNFMTANNTSPRLQLRQQYFIC